MLQGKILSYFAPLDTLNDICINKQGKYLSINDVNIMMPFIKKACEAAEKISQFALEQINSNDKEDEQLKELLFLKCSSLNNVLSTTKFNGHYCAADNVNFSIQSISNYLFNIVQVYAIMQDNSKEKKNNINNDNENLQSIINNQAEQIKELEKQVEHAKQLENNKDSNEPKWIDWLDDDVFKPGINAEMIYKSLVNISAAHLSDRPKCYVLFRVLDVIKARKKNATQKDILKWWNAHFGCDWHNDNQFKFTNLPDSILNENNILKWNKCQGRNSEHYYSYAQELLKEFAWNEGQGEYEIKKIYLK